MKRIINTLKDQDYTHKLSEKDRKWLKEFNNQYYNHNYSNNTITPEDQVEAHRIEASRREDSARRCIMNAGTRVGGDEVLDLISNEDYQAAMSGNVTRGEKEMKEDELKVIEEYYCPKLKVKVKKYEAPKFKSEQKISSTGQSFEMDVDKEQRRMAAYLDVKAAKKKR